jgi:hypothetical protein
MKLEGIPARGRSRVVRLMANFPPAGVHRRSNVEDASVSVLIVAWRQIGPWRATLGC